jgi:TRAP-type C4-dicarboxylate transport system substrate-binding protein
MRWMRSQARLATLSLAVIATVVAGACTSGGGVGDKAGGSGEPVVLRLANTSSNLTLLPAVLYFVDRVKELSAGNVRIAVADRWGNFSADAEQQVVEDVSTGEIDLGWVGTRVFDTMGVKSFQALTAPMLIDSYALENAVIHSGIPDQLMQGLDDVGVAGLGVLADGLRKPIGVNAPIVGVADWRDITFGTYKSESQAQAIRALGATPAEVFGTYREQAIDNRTIQGFEFNLYNYRDPRWLRRAPYVTANINLWPQMDVLLANRDRLGSLSGQQQGWLRQAAQDAANRSAALADTDAQSIRVACDAGARFADASKDDLAGLQSALAPVYADLQRDPETKALIQRIQVLKRSTPAPSGLAIPSGCTGKAPERFAENTGTAPAYLNGTYRYELTKEDARKGGEANLDEFPVVNTVTLKDGQVAGGCFGAGATYSVDNDRIKFNTPEYGYSMTFTFSTDDQSNLHLTPVLPMDRGDAFMCSAKIWMKIA